MNITFQEQHERLTSEREAVAKEMAQTSIAMRRASARGVAKILPIYTDLKRRYDGLESAIWQLLIEYPKEAARLNEGATR